MTKAADHLRETIRSVGKSYASLFAELELEALSINDKTEIKEKQENNKEEHIKKCELFFADDINGDKLCMDAICRLGWTVEKAKKAFAAYKKFIVVKSLLYDFDIPSYLSPPTAVDELWHIHLSNTKKYFDACMRAFGTVLHHESSLEYDETHTTRLRRARAQIHNIFPDENIDDPIWSDTTTSSGSKSQSEENSQTTTCQKTPGLSIKVKHIQSQQELYFKLNSTTLLSKVFSCCSERFQFHPSTARFFYGGIRIHGDQTPAQLEMSELDQIDLVLEHENYIQPSQVEPLSTSPSSSLAAAPDQPPPPESR